VARRVIQALKDDLVSGKVVSAASCVLCVCATACDGSWALITRCRAGYHCLCCHGKHVDANIVLVWSEPSLRGGGVRGHRERSQRGAGCGRLGCSASAKQPFYLVLTPHRDVFVFLQRRQACRSLAAMEPPWPRGRAPGSLRRRPPQWRSR
jgi:hypothetical protein